MIPKLIIILLSISTTLTSYCTIQQIPSCPPPSDICPPDSDIYIKSSFVYPDNCSYPFELQGNSIFVEGGRFKSLYLNAEQITIQSSQYSGYLNISFDFECTIQGTLNIQDCLTIYQPNNTQTSINGSLSISQSTLIIQKILLIVTDSLIQFQQTTITVDYYLCLYEPLNINILSNQIKDLKSNSNITGLAELNFTVFISSSQDIYLCQNTSLFGAFIAIVGENNMYIDEANISANAMSCKPNTGLGRGTIIQYQDKYCSSGSSSCGYGTISSPQCVDIVEYFLFLNHGFPYINKGPYLSTGSGGYGYFTQPKNNGAGGGVIYLQIMNNLSLSHANISANGGDVFETDQLSAGSGGTVFITSMNITAINTNNISVVGGTAYNKNGSGSGGLTKISYQTITKANDINDVVWVDVFQGGSNTSSSVYSNGVFYGPLCFPGYQSNYLSCQKCPSGYYSSIGDPICKPCPSSHDYQINPNSVGNSIKECYYPKKISGIYTWLLPGQISLLNIALYLVFLIVFILVGLVLRKKIKQDKLSNKDQFRIDQFQKQNEQQKQKKKIFTDKFKQSKTIAVDELMYHVHRIHCYGFNNQESPWMLPIFPPQQIKKYVLPQAFQQFAHNFNKLAQWTQLEYYLTKFSLIFYPLYWYYLDNLKKSKYHKLLNILEQAKQFNLINNYDYQDKNIITIKFSKSKDYTNCYIDFFMYEKADMKYHTLSSPLIISLSGEGNFLRPFYLEDEEVFYKTMFFIVNRNFNKKVQEQIQDHQLDEKKRLFTNLIDETRRKQNSSKLLNFHRKLNSLTCTCDIHAPRNILVKTLGDIVNFINEWNQKFFSKVALKVDIIMILSHIKSQKLVNNEIHILTKKDNETFQQFINNKKDQVQKWKKKSIRIGLFVYNPEQQIPTPQIQIPSSKQIIQERSFQSSSQSDGVSIVLSEPLLHSEKSLQNSQFSEQQGQILSIIVLKITRLIHLMRYFMFSHRQTHHDEYTIKFIQALFILMQTMLLFIWSIKLQIPYVFVNLVSPFIGIVWTVSDSYGFGKLFLILNSMNLVNEVITLVAYSIIQSTDGTEDKLLNTIISAAINIIIILILMFVGCRAITNSKKLSLTAEE